MIYDEDDDNGCWDMTPPQKEYPPIVPVDLKFVLAESSEMIDEARKLKDILKKAIDTIQKARLVYLTKPPV